MIFNPRTGLVPARGFGRIKNMQFISKEKTGWKRILIIIILAVTAGGVVFWFSDRTDFSGINFEIKIPERVKKETADWNIYRNEEYGFEIKYPKDWNQGPNILRALPYYPNMVFCPPEFSEPKSDSKCRWITETSGMLNSPGPIFLFVDVWEKFKGETKEEKKNTSWCELEEKKTTNAIEMEFFDCNGQKRAYWEDPAGTYFYRLFLADTEFINEFKQMLLTFKFK